MSFLKNYVFIYLVNGPILIAYLEALWCVIFNQKMYTKSILLLLWKQTYLSHFWPPCIAKSVEKSVSTPRASCFEFSVVFKNAFFLIETQVFVINWLQWHCNLFSCNKNVKNVFLHYQKKSIDSLFKQTSNKESSLVHYFVYIVKIGILLIKSPTRAKHKTETQSCNICAI